MKSQNTKSSDQLHREVKEELKNVQRDVDRLQGRLTPGQIIDDAIFRTHGQNLGSTLDHMKNNPVGTAFLSLGTLMLMEDENHQTMESHAKVKLSTAKHRLNDLKDQTNERAKNKLNEAKGKIANAKESMQSKVSEIKHGIESKIPSTEEIKQTFQNKVTDVKQSVSEEGESLEQNARNIDPLTYMALGAGLGALTGASLPVADFEREFVDDKLQTKISSFSDDLQTAVNECANMLKDLVIQDAKNYTFKVF